MKKIAEAFDIFKVIVCFSRNERRAPQTWDVGGVWDRLLMDGHKLFVRFEGDFHQHFEDGGYDYYPCEFQQDVLHVEKNSYSDIIKAYQTGSFYSVVENLISEPVFRVEESGENRKITLSFRINSPMDELLLISDGACVREWHEFSGDTFFWQDELPKGKYFRVRGAGKPEKRKYQDGEYVPVFMLNPIFDTGEL